METDKLSYKFDLVVIIIEECSEINNRTPIMADNDTKTKKQNPKDIHAHMVEYLLY